MNLSVSNSANILSKCVRIVSGRTQPCFMLARRTLIISHVRKNTAATNSANKGMSSREIRKFDRLSSQWWDETGPFKALHSFNTVRVPWIVKHMNTQENSPYPLKGEVAVRINISRSACPNVCSFLKKRKIKLTHAKYLIAI